MSPRSAEPKPRRRRLPHRRRSSRPQSSGKRGNARRRILFALLPLVLAGSAYAYATGGQIMSTENAYVQADMVGISTDIDGTVSEVDVRDNQRVKAGDVLFRLDDQQFRLALDRADAQVGLVKNDIEALKANYKAMQAQIAQAVSDIAFYQTSFKRQQDLATKSVASQASYDRPSTISTAPSTRRPCWSTSSPASPPI
jgi:membrane fusion protein (multidrug efflux system)